MKPNRASGWVTFIAKLATERNTYRGNCIHPVMHGEERQRLKDLTAGVLGPLTAIRDRALQRIGIVFEAGGRIELLVRELKA